MKEETTYSCRTPRTTVDIGKVVDGRPCLPVIVTTRGVTVDRSFIYVVCSFIGR